MNFDEFLKNLNNPEKTRNFNIFKNYSLDEFESSVKIMELHKKLGQTNFPLRISIVGTNGKGSVSHILSMLANKSGLYKKIGLYTSPHLLRKEERINLNGENISTEKLNSLFTMLSGQYEKNLSEMSYFELFTILAFYFFKNESCDLEIYEAGLGGRLDATRMAFSEILVVTKIGLDHSEILGKTKEAILKEKLAISSEFTKYLFYYDQEDCLLNDIISDHSKKNHIRAFLFPERFQKTDYLSYNRRFGEFILGSIHPEYDFSKLQSKRVNIPGRIEVLQENPKIVFDVAHNVSAIEYLLKSINNTLNFQEFDVLFSCLKDKDADGMLKTLSGEDSVARIYYYSSEYSNVIQKEEKIKIIDEEGLKNLFNNRDKPLVITGSFRLYSLVKEILESRL